jgi:hypothetical protein
MNPKLQELRNSRCDGLAGRMSLPPRVFTFVRKRAGWPPHNPKLLMQKGFDKEPPRITV